MWRWWGELHMEQIPNHMLQLTRGFTIHKITRCYRLFWSKTATQFATRLTFTRIRIPTYMSLVVFFYNCIFVALQRT